VIDNLKKEISNLEQLLTLKKEELAKLIEDEKFKNKNQLIALAEMRDQFAGITDLLLVNNTPEDIENVRKQFEDNFMCGYRVHFYKIKDIKKAYRFLNENMDNSSYSQSTLYEWMDKNEKYLINKEY
jgi:hypothetical protein